MKLKKEKTEPRIKMPADLQTDQANNHANIILQIISTAANKSDQPSTSARFVQEILRENIIATIPLVSFINRTRKFSAMG